MHQTLNSKIVSLINIVILLIVGLQMNAFGKKSIHVLENKELLAIEVANVIINEVKEHNCSGRPYVLGLPTGSTPTPIYKELVKRFKHDDSIDFSNVITFNLDEYIGISETHPESYHAYMKQHLFTPELMHSSENPRGFRSDNIFIPKAPAGSSNMLKKHAENYEALIRKHGPIDLQLLGIGKNGHLGFAEPGSALDGRTMIVKLHESTRKANSRFFNNDIRQVPTHALTMGIGTILEAKKIILLATGDTKARIIKETFKYSPTPLIPATALKTHDDVTYYLDADAGKLLNP